MATETKATAAAAARATKKGRSKPRRIRAFPGHLLRWIFCLGCALMLCRVWAGWKRKCFALRHRFSARIDLLQRRNDGTNDGNARLALSPRPSTSTSLLLSNLKTQKKKTEPQKHPGAPRDQEVQQIPQAPHRAQGDQVEGTRWGKNRWRWPFCLERRLRKRGVFSEFYPKLELFFVFLLLAN